MNWPADMPAVLTRSELQGVLDQAEHEMATNPGRGRQLAEQVRAASRQAGVDDLYARACYLAARAYAMNADHETAIQRIAEAYQGYQAAGLLLDMLRTNAGLINILRDLGRYDEALQVAVQTISGISSYGLAADPDAALLIGLIYQNSGLCYEQMGQYEQALEAHNAAEQQFRALGLVEALGEIGNNRGIVLLALGRPTNALQIFTESATIFADAGLMLPYATTLINLGNAHLLLGQYTQCLRVFARARQIYETLDAQADTNVLLIDTGDAYMALNQYAEALRSYQDASQRLQAAQMPFEQARALWGMGTALLAQHKLQQAALAFDHAVALFEQVGNHAMLAGVLLERSALQAQQQQHAAARATAARALALVEGQDLPVQQIYAHLRLADLHGHDASAAEQHLISATALSASVALPHTAFRLAQRMGNLRLHQGRIDEARVLLSSAITQLEQLRGTVASEALRISFFQDKVAVYEDLLRLQLLPTTHTSPWAALVTAEQARARALRDRLVAPGHSAAPDGSTSLHDDLHAIYTELLNGNVAHAPARHAVLRERAAALEQAITHHHLHQAEMSGIALAAPPSEAALRERLAQYPGLLVFQLVGDQIMAFVALGGTLQVIPHISQVGIIEALLTRLASQWERLVSAPAFVERHLPQLERSVRLVLAELYQALFGPLADLLAQLPQTPSRLVIIPHGLLHQIPFHALYDGEQYLVDRYELSIAPSVMALAPTGIAALQSERAVLVGVADPRIPQVPHELAAIQAFLPAATVLRDAAATRQAVTQQATRCGVLHLACHGIFRSDNPMFSALQLGDGWLTAMEITQLDLADTLVVLSACESGRGRVYDGDEVLGLARAFLIAGARALLGSLWLVQDSSTALLMEYWYAGLAQGLPPVTALRQAQIQLRERFPHPYYWAPFYCLSRS